MSFSYEFLIPITLSSYPILDQANRSGANLKDADLCDAFLGGVHLQDADMGGARVTPEQLA